MSDNLSHEQQEDWEQWIDWMDTQDWDSVGLGTGLECDDASGVRTTPVPVCMVAEHCAKLRADDAQASMGILSVSEPDSGRILPVITSDIGVSGPAGEALDSCEDEADVANSVSSEADADGTKGIRRDLALKCAVDGCTYQGTFPRQWELQRHVRVKHTRAKTFACPVKGCFKGTAVTSVARSDKLTDHIRATHPLDANADCPIDYCTTSLPLDLLIVHMTLRHRKREFRGFFRTISHNFTEHGQSVINVPNRRKCIHWSCSAKVPLDKLLDHFETHSSVELECMQDDLLENGYLVVLPSEISENPKVKIVCPICGELSDSFEAFQGHLFGRHIADQGKIRRLSKVKDLENIMKRVDSGHFTLGIGRQDLDCDRKCPGCEETVNDESHYCNLFRQECIPEVKAHRQLLLRLCPQIVKVKMGYWRVDDPKEAFFDDL